MVRDFYDLEILVLSAGVRLRGARGDAEQTDALNEYMSRASQLADVTAKVRRNATGCESPNVIVGTIAA